MLPAFEVRRCLRGKCSILLLRVSLARRFVSLALTNGVESHIWESCVFFSRGAATHIAYLIFALCGLCFLAIRRALLIRMCLGFRERRMRSQVGAAVGLEQGTVLASLPASVAHLESTTNARIVLNSHVWLPGRTKICRTLRGTQASMSQRPPGRPPPIEQFKVTISNARVACSFIYVCALGVAHGRCHGTSSDNPIS